MGGWLPERTTSKQLQVLIAYELWYDFLLIELIHSKIHFDYNQQTWVFKTEMPLQEQIIEISGFNCGWLGFLTKLFHSMWNHEFGVNRSKLWLISYMQGFPIFIIIYGFVSRRFFWRWRSKRKNTTRGSIREKWQKKLERCVLNI